jgi:putative DNA primase/helicase
MFSTPVYKLLFELVDEWANPDQEVSLHWLKQKLTALKQLDEIGGEYGLSELFDFEPSAANAEVNIDLVREAYKRKEIILRLDAAKDRCYEGRLQASEIASDLKEAIASIEADSSHHLSALLDWSLSGEEFGSIQIPPRPPIIRPWFMEGDLGFVYAFRGSGKTWFVLSLASALADGSKCGPWQVSGQWPVLYIDGEMMSADIQQRVKALNEGDVPRNLHVLNHEILYQNTEVVLNLVSPAKQQQILQVCLQKRIRVLVLDNLGCLFSGMKENDADDWEKVLPWLLEMRRHKIAVIIVHHTGVDSTRMRGTTKREDPAAFSVRLEDKRDDFKEPGARFVTHFTKYRGSEPLFNYEWNYKRSGELVTVSHEEASRADAVLQWVKDGLDTCGEIAAEMKISPGQVSKLATQLIKEGKLRKNGRRYEVVEADEP